MASTQNQHLILCLTVRYWVSAFPTVRNREGCPLAPLWFSVIAVLCSRVLSVHTVPKAQCPAAIPPEVTNGWYLNSAQMRCRLGAPAKDEVGPSQEESLWKVPVASYPCRGKGSLEKFFPEDMAPCSLRAAWDLSWWSQFPWGWCLFQVYSRIKTLGRRSNLGERLQGVGSI